ncbi:hypothetical protein CI238_01665, partial [Colletotrichum incanum]
LTSLAEQITNKTWIVQIMGMDGKMTWDPIGWDYSENEPIQRLVIPSPSNQPDELPRPSCSVNVERATMPTQLTSAQVGKAVEKIHAEFDKHKKAWEASLQCKKLKDILL